MTILYLKIPKTGGTSMKSFLISNTNGAVSIATPEIMVFGQEFSRVVSLVRNPYRWAFSSYMYYKKNVMLSSIEMTFADYLLGKYENKNNYLSSIRGKTQSSALSQCNALNLTIDKIYKLEQIIECERDYCGEFYHANMGFYTYEDYLAEYTNEIVNTVFNMLKVDFDSFGYPYSFIESCKEFESDDLKSARERHINSYEVAKSSENIVRAAHSDKLSK